MNFNKLLEKGKAKVKDFQHSHSSPSSSAFPGHGHQGQNQPPQQYPQQQQQQYPPQPYPPQQQYPPQQYTQQQYTGAPYPPPHSPYNAPPSPYNNAPPQYGGYGPPSQQQWGAPPPNHGDFGAPPIPMNSKPTSPLPQGQPPPVPMNRPPSFSNPPQTSLNPPQTENLKIYWRPNLDQATPVGTNFRHELGAHGWGNNESQNYVASPQNSFHTPAHQLVVRATAQNGTYTSARLTSHQTLSRPKGYLEARILPPCAEGVWPAFWMLPADPFKWPTDGEVDIMETWNNELKNHSCLHWGNYDGADHDKHRVIETPILDMAYKEHVYGFSWIEEEGIPDFRGRMIWYIDGRPVMRGYIPAGTRRMEDYRLLINVAMGGTVCGGKLPRDGMYDLVVSDLKFCEEPAGGWAAFESSWNAAPEGKTM